MCAQTKFKNIKSCQWAHNNRITPTSFRALTTNYCVIRQFVIDFICLNSTKLYALWKRSFFICSVNARAQLSVECCRNNFSLFDLWLNIDRGGDWKLFRDDATTFNIYTNLVAACWSQNGHRRRLAWSFLSLFYPWWINTGRRLLVLKWPYESTIPFSSNHSKPSSGCAHFSLRYAKLTPVIWNNSTRRTVRYF